LTIMNMKSTSLVLGTCMIAAGAAAAGTTAPANGRVLDLMQAYELAMENDPAIRRARAELERAREASPQARAALLPQLGLSASIQESTTDGTQIGFDDATGEIGLVDFRSSLDTTAYGVELRQPLFRWEAIVGLGEARSAVARAEAVYETTLQDALIRVAEVYLQVLLATESLDTAVATREAFAKERERAEYGREIGVFSTVDVEEARAAHDRALAGEIAARRQLEIAIEALEEVIDVPVAAVAGPVAEIEPSLPSPENVDAWVARALDQNLDILAASLGADVAAERVRRARSAHLPTVDLVASRRYTDQSGDNPFQTQDVVGDSIRVELNMPLFSGGAIRSRTREASAAERSAREDLNMLSRQVRRQTRDAYLGIASDIARVSALSQAVRSSRTALEATEVGVEIGSRSTIDLVEARRQLAAAETEYSAARFDYLLNTLRLRRAAGDLSADDLIRMNRLFGGDD
jgi:outer membrane protein